MTTKRPKLKPGLEIIGTAYLIFLISVQFAAADSAATGEELAKQLRSTPPWENSEVHGTNIISRNKTTIQVPIVCKVELKDQTWITEYKTSATTNLGAQLLSIIHSSNAPNEYLFARAPSPTAALPEPSRIPPADADIPFAGSDFSLSDLGLEFLHWPQQRRLRDQTRLGRACYVLESRNSAQHGIVRVLSYIDQETGGLLIATAYDAGSNVVKEFSLHGSSFIKVHGHWRLEKMQIHDYKAHSQTELKFDVNN